MTISATPPPFGFDAFDSTFSADPAGAPLTQAGAHPYESATPIDLNTLRSTDK